MLEFLKASFLIQKYYCYLCWWYYSRLCESRHLVCDNNMNWLWMWLWPTGHCGLEQELTCWFLPSYLPTYQSFNIQNPHGRVEKFKKKSLLEKLNSGGIDLKMNGSALEEKWFSKILGFFSSKLDWSFTAKAASNISLDFRVFFQSVVLFAFDLFLFLCFS